MFSKNRFLTEFSDERLEEKRKESEEETDLPSEDDWRFQINAEDTIQVSGEEVGVVNEEEEVYAGEYVRKIIDSRKEKPKDYTWFGYTRNPNRGIEEVGIPYETLFMHIGLFGVTGQGKSTVMMNMIHQWINANFGVCFIDPKGDDSVDMMQVFPEERVDDLLWIEPGAPGRENVVGFNYFDAASEPGTTDRITEANKVSNDFINLIEAMTERDGGGMMDDESNWNPEMQAVLDALVPVLVQAEEDYSIVDLYQILDDPAERDAFLAKHGESLEGIQRTRISELHSSIDPDSELREMKAQIEKFVSKSEIRETLANERSKVNLAQAVLDGKIIIINPSELSESEMQVISAAIVQRIWSTMRSPERLAKSMNDRDPFFICADEYAKITKDREDEMSMLMTEDITSRARTFRLSMFIATQQPNQLAQDVQNSVYNNCNSLFTFNPGNWQDAQNLAEGIGDVDSNALQDLQKYTLAGRVTIDGDPSPPLLIHNFPEYPPVRTREEADSLISRSVEINGVERREEINLEDFGPSRFQERHESGTITGRDIRISGKHVLAAIEANGSTSMDGHEDWISSAKLEEVFQRFAPAVDFSEIEDTVIRPLVGLSIEHEVEDGESLYRLTDEGRDELLEREVLGTRNLLKALKHLSSLGYRASLPTNTDVMSNYDGIADPPINPVEEGENMSEVKEMASLLRTRYPDVYEKFKDKQLLLSTITNPKTEMDVIARHIDLSGKKEPVFVCNEDKLEEFEKGLSSPMFVRSEDRGEEVLYTTERPLPVGDEKIAVVDKDYVWKQKGQIDLVLSDEKTLLSYDDYQELRSGEASTSDFEYVASQDGQSVTVLAENDKGEMNEVESFESVEELESESRFRIVREPFVPDSVFISEHALPDEDEFSILVIPEDSDPYFTGYEEDATGLDPGGS